jgi:hypothetical protein
MSTDRLVGKCGQMYGREAEDGMQTNCRPNRVIEGGHRRMVETTQKASVSSGQTEYCLVRVMPKRINRDEKTKTSNRRLQT